MLRRLLIVVIAATAHALPSCVDCPEYVRASAADKQQVCWNRMVQSEYQGGYSNAWPGLSGKYALLTESMNEPFDRFSDEMPADRVKVIHTLGGVAKVKFVADGNTKYTGMLKGSDYGFARLSLAGPPGSGSPFFPGMAIKFLRDSTYSANVITMFKSDGQADNYNFFENQMKSWLSEGEGLKFFFLSNVIFAKGAKDSFRLSVDGTAVANQDGSTVKPEDVEFPQVLYFKPAIPGFKTTPHDFRNDLATIKAGTTIYEVWAANDCSCGEGQCDKVEQCKDGHKIGNLVTTSRFIMSEWGDKGMFFQHYRYAKKGRRTCKYARNLPDDDIGRLSGDLSSACVAGSCPVLEKSGFGPFKWGGTKAKSSSEGCPFHTNDLSKYIADPLDEDDNVQSSSNTAAITVGVVGAACMIGVAVAVIVVRRRRGPGFQEMQESL